MRDWLGPAALALLVLSSAGLLQGCGGNPPKKPEPKGPAKALDAEIDCKKEAPMLCGEALKDDPHDYFPQGLKEICGGHGEDSDMVLHYCRETCGKEHTVAKMSICIAETLVKHAVFAWRIPQHDGQDDDTKVHPVCKEFVDRVCATDGFGEVCGEKGRKDKLAQECRSKCELMPGLAKCMRNQVFAQQSSDASEGGGLGTLDFFEQVEASVLSESWFVPYPHLKLHNKDVLAAALAARGGTHEDISQKLEELGLGEGRVPDTHGFERKGGDSAQLQQQAADSANQVAADADTLRDRGGLLTTDVVHTITVGATQPANPKEVAKTKSMIAAAVSDGGNSKLVAAVELVELHGSQAPRGLPRTEPESHGSVMKQPLPQAWVVDPHGAHHHGHHHGHGAQRVLAPDV